jgi:hypothetical protein
MTVITTVEYRIYSLHNRFMIEEFLNGNYDSFCRALNADMGELVGESFLSNLENEATYVLTQHEGCKWTLTTMDGKGNVGQSKRAVSEDKVRHLFEVLPVGFRLRTLGEDVETNYEYRNASK